MNATSDTPNEIWCEMENWKDQRNSLNSTEMTLPSVELWSSTWVSVPTARPKQYLTRLYWQPSSSVASGVTTNSYPNETEKMAFPFHRNIIISLRTCRTEDIYAFDVPVTTSCTHGLANEGQKMENNIPISNLAFSFRARARSMEADTRHAQTHCVLGAFYPLSIG